VAPRVLTAIRIARAVIAALKARSSAAAGVALLRISVSARAVAYFELP